MIRLYSGTPGSGKSLHNAKDVINRSRLGKPVIGNFPCDLSKYPRAKYTYVPNYELTPEFLMNYSREYFKDKPIKEGKLLLVIDECQLMFNSRDWQQKGRNEWLAFFTQHRKYGYDITLIAQFDRMIDKQLRGVIESEYIHRKMSNYGIGGKLLSVLFGGNTFVVVQMWYPMKLKVSSEFVHARKKFFSIYDTFGTFTNEAPSSAPAATSADVAGDVSAPEEQNADQTDAHEQDPVRCGVKLSSLCGQFISKILKVNRIKIFGWTIWSRSGKYLQEFPEGRNEFGWKEGTVYE